MGAWLLDLGMLGSGPYLSSEFSSWIHVVFFGFGSVFLFFGGVFLVQNQRWLVFFVKVGGVWTSIYLGCFLAENLVSQKPHCPSWCGAMDLANPAGFHHVFDFLLTQRHGKTSTLFKSRWPNNQSAESTSLKKVSQLALCLNNIIAWSWLQVLSRMCFVIRRILNPFGRILNPCDPWIILEPTTLGSYKWVTGVITPLKKGLTGDVAHLVGWH